MLDKTQTKFTLLKKRISKLENEKTVLVQEIERYRKRNEYLEERIQQTELLREQYEQPVVDLGNTQEDYLVLYRELLQSKKHYENEMKQLLKELD